jgi:hypothetical protein
MATPVSATPAPDAIRKDLRLGGEKLDIFRFLHRVNTAPHASVWEVFRCIERVLAMQKLDLHHKNALSKVRAHT